MTYRIRFTQDLDIISSPYGGTGSSIGIFTVYETIDAALKDVDYYFQGLLDDALFAFGEPVWAYVMVCEELDDWVLDLWMVAATKVCDNLSGYGIVPTDLLVDIDELVSQFANELPPEMFSKYQSMVENVRQSIGSQLNKKGIDEWSN